MLKVAHSWKSCQLRAINRKDVCHQWPTMKILPVGSSLKAHWLQDCQLLYFEKTHSLDAIILQNDEMLTMVQVNSKPADSMVQS